MQARRRHCGIFLLEYRVSSAKPLYSDDRKSQLVRLFTLNLRAKYYFIISIAFLGNRLGTGKNPIRRTAYSVGLSDEDRLKRQLPVYDALYAYVQNKKE